MALLVPRDEILACPPSAAGVRIGRSRQGRPIFGERFGRGPLRISLIAGCHADEPVGPAMLERWVSCLRGLPPSHPALAEATWAIVPHVNPDGDAANAAWAEPLPADDEGYDFAAYLAGVVRELPGDDVEFGFPRRLHDGDETATATADALVAERGARPENRAVAAFLAGGGPYHLHATFHGMAFAAGPWFLLEAGWTDRTGAMREALRRTVRALGYRLHDIDRGGEKGFTRIDEGFTTRPDSRAMQRFFLDRGEPETAALFRPSSMEFIRGLGGDPLTLVSEMPLFFYPQPAERAPTADDPFGADDPPEADAPPLPTEPATARRFVAWALRRLRADGPAALRREVDALGLRPMPIGDQMRLQLAFLEAGLEAVRTAAAETGS